MKSRIPRAIGPAAMVIARDHPSVTINDKINLGSGARLTYTLIPFASHSLKSLIIAGPMIEHAIDLLVGG